MGATQSPKHPLPAPRRPFPEARVPTESCARAGPAREREGRCARQGEGIALGQGPPVPQFPLCFQDLPRVLVPGPWEPLGPLVPGSRGVRAALAPLEGTPSWRRGWDPVRRQAGATGLREGRARVRPRPGRQRLPDGAGRPLPRPGGTGRGAGEARGGSGSRGPACSLPPGRGRAVPRGWAQGEPHPSQASLPLPWCDRAPSRPCAPLGDRTRSARGRGRGRGGGTPRYTRP